MSSHLPRIRADLIVTRHELREGTTFVVKDPVTEQFYRFGEVEHFVLQQLDGATPPEAVRRRVQERFGAILDAEMLVAFVANLREHRLLESAAPGARAGRTRSGNPLYLRFKAFDPDRLLDAIARTTGFLFTPAFVVAALVLILAALVIVAGNGRAMVAEALAVPPVAGLAFAWLVFLTVGMAHELAHGVACKHFGGRVREIGFMFLYFQPALYCNVSDAWLFPKKSQRLWVTIAGSGFELLLWALAVIVWRVTEPGTPPHFLALVVAGASGIKTLLNFNPLLKLDGYYLLSDLLEIPNLWRRSFQYVGASLRRIFGVVDPVLVEGTPRERRIYAIYGTLALTFSIVFLGFLVVRLGGHLLGRYQLLGVVPFVLLVTMIVRRRLGRLAPRRARSTALVRSEPSTALATAGTTAIGPRERKALAPRRRSRLVPALATAGFAAAAAAIALAPASLRVGGEFSVLPARNADVRAQVDGFVEEVLVREGEPVQRGQTIARLRNRDLGVELQRLRSQEQEQRIVGEYARTNLARYRALLAADVVSRKEFETAEQQMKVNVAEQARIAAERRLVEKQMESAAVVSPIDGIVATPARQLLELRGRFLRQGDLLAVVHDLRQVTAEIAVPEREIADVRVGQPVTLKARAYPQAAFTGRVASVATTVRPRGSEPASTLAGMAPASTNPSGDREVLVTTVLDNPDLLLKPDMTGRAKIECGRQRAGELLVRRLARTVRVELWSWW